MSGKANSKANGKITQPDPTYGTFEYRDQIVEFKPDSDLRDNEDVPLTRETALGSGVDAVNEAYFRKEVAPHVKDAWICLLYTSPSPRDQRGSRMPSSA